MPDEITGIAVLQETWIPGIHQLHFRATRATGERLQSQIFIRDEKDNHLPDKMPNWGDGTNSVWKFRRSGTKLECHPSVNWISANFHNAYNWAVEFVEMQSPTTLAKAYDEPDKRWRRAGSVCYDIQQTPNPAEVIAEMRAANILK